MGNLNKIPFVTFVRTHHSKPVYQSDIEDMSAYKQTLMDYFLYGRDDKGKPPSAYKKQRVLEEIRRTDAWLKLAAEKFINNNNTKINC